MQEDQPKSFPYSVPNNEEVEVDLTLAQSINPNLSEKEMFCNVCIIPMRVRYFLQPCEHFICQKCFERDLEECPCCGFEVIQINSQLNEQL